MAISSSTDERWAGLEIRHLAAFVAVAEGGSFVRPAEQLGYTQSAVSQQIGALERLVGHRLLIRNPGGRRPVEPTEVGATLLQHSRKILGQVSAAHADVVAQQHGDSSMRLATFPSLGVRVLPDVLRQLGHLATRIEVVERHSDQELYRCVLSGAAELAFAVLPAPPDVVAVELGEDPYVAVVAARSCLARRAFVSLDALRGLPLLGLRLQGHEERVQDALAAAGLEPGRIERYDDNRLVQALAGAESGVAVVPRLTVDPADSAVSVLELRPRIPPRRIALAHHRGRQLSVHAQAFLDGAVALCREALARAA
jgi:DNA-binding transcriptional LysR family regulator